MTESRDVQIWNDGRRDGEHAAGRDRQWHGVRQRATGTWRREATGDVILYIYIRQAIACPTTVLSLPYPAL